MTTPLDDTNPLFDPLILVLWTQPYCDWFAVRHGGLPGDWVRRGLVTGESIKQCQRDTGHTSAWSA